MSDWTAEDAQAITPRSAWRFFQGYWDEVHRDDPNYMPWAEQSLPMKVLGSLFVLPMVLGMVRRHRRTPD